MWAGAEERLKWYDDMDVYYEWLYLVKNDGATTDL